MVPANWAMPSEPIPIYIAAMGPETMPFDPKRMTYGGFKVLVDA